MSSWCSSWPCRYLVGCSERWGFFTRDGFCQAGLHWVAKVLEAQLRTQPWVLSRFIASLKAGLFLLILLIRDICFVKQNHPSIKMEHNFMPFFFFFFNIHAKIAISPTCPRKPSWRVRVQNFTKPQVFPGQIPLNTNSQCLTALSQSQGLSLIAWEAMGVFNLLKKQQKWALNTLCVQ